MSTINLDLSQKIDISCREGDDFSFDIGAEDENGNPLENLLIKNDFTNDIVLFCIRNLKKEPVKIFTNDFRAQKDMSDRARGFNSNTSTQEVNDNYEKRGVAIQKVLNSREINAIAFTDLYHPLRTQPLNSSVGGLFQEYSVRTKESADKIWFTIRHLFIHDGFGLQPSIQYNQQTNILSIFADSVAFNLPFGKYKYDIKILSGLYCPTNINTGAPIIEKSVFESVTTLIHGSLDVKKD